MGSRNHGSQPAFELLTTNQVNVEATATEIVAGAQARAEVILTNGTTDVTIFIGNSTSLTTTNGMYLYPQKTLTLRYFGPVYGIVVSGTSKISVGSLS